MTKTTKLKTNQRAVTVAVQNYTGAYETSGKATAMIDATAIALGAALDNNGLSMFVVVNAKENAKFENWFKTWGAIFGDDESVVQQTYEACREIIDALRKKHEALLKKGLTKEGFNTMLQRVRKHMFLSKTDKNKGKDARKRATAKENKSLFTKVSKIRNDKKPAQTSSTPKVTASTFDKKHAAIVKKIEDLQKAFAPINAYIIDTQDERTITKAAIDIINALNESLDNLDTLKGAK